MTENNPSEMDPAATFRLDQEAARAEEVDRDQWTWDSHVRAHDAVVAQQTAQAAFIKAKANVLDAIATLVWLAIATAVLYGLGLAARNALEAIR